MLSGLPTSTSEKEAESTVPRASILGCAYPQRMSSEANLLHMDFIAGENLADRGSLLLAASPGGGT